MPPLPWWISLSFMGFRFFWGDSVARPGWDATGEVAGVDDGDEQARPSDLAQDRPRMRRSGPA